MTELALSQGLTRGDLLFPFAKKRRQTGGSQPPKTPARTTLSTPPPDGGFRFGRRAGLAVAGIGILGMLAGILKPWEKFDESEEKRNWENAPALERIRRLEFRQFPKFSGFDHDTEMISATVQHFCSRIGCSGEDLAKTVLLATPDRIAEEVDFDNDFTLTKEEKEQYGKESLEMFGFKRKLVLVNSQNIYENAADFDQAKPNYTPLQGRSAYGVILKSRLYHGYAHAVANKEESHFPPITLNSTGSTYNTLREGFMFTGTTSQGEKTHLTGGNEALTEYVATVIGQETGPFLGTSRYSSGFRLVDALNKRSGVSPKDMEDYWIGRKKRDELFRKWGALKNPNNPDETAARQALMVIALRVDFPQNLSEEAALANINTLLKP